MAKTSGAKKPGWLLAHNRVVHEPETKHGVDGFRRFWIPPEWLADGSWVPCPCGWRPDLGVHHAAREYVAEITSSGG
jgi:hypothetical protein